MELNETAGGSFYLRLDRTSNGSLCGMPGFCAKTSYNACYSIPLYKCDDCSFVGAGVAAAILTIFAVAIVVGNSMVIASVFCNGKRGKTKLGYTKASLAVADLINGFHLMCVILPNIGWTLSVTAQQLDLGQLLSVNSPVAIAGSFFYGLSYVASIDHLNYLAIQRWIAIKWPFWWRAKGNSNTWWWLALIWIGAVATCIVLLTKRDFFIVGYLHNVFLYQAQFTMDGKFAILVEISLVFIFLILPFLSMTFFSTWTGLLVCATSRKSKSMRLERDRAKLIKNEIEICKSLLLMEMGFFVTLLPGALWLVLFYSGQVSCEASGITLLVGLFLSSSNSLVNVIVYSFRDKNFIEISRKLVAFILCRQTSLNLRKIEPRKLPNSSRTENRTDVAMETNLRT